MNNCPLVNPLIFVWQRCTMSVAPLDGVGVRNGINVSGGDDQESWLDAYTTQTPKTRTYLRLRRAAKRLKSGRALHSATQQNSGHDPRTNYSQVGTGGIDVLPVTERRSPDELQPASESPCFPATVLSIMPYGKTYGNR